MVDTTRKISLTSFYKQNKLYKIYLRTVIFILRIEKNYYSTSIKR
jgi:hypothetical protein